MEAQLEQIREQQKETWNKFSPGWKKWDDLTMDFLKSQGDEIIRRLNLKETDHVLDIASGTGEPALSIAKIIKHGNVMLTDLSEGMLNVAVEKAEKKGIKNIETKVCDISNLPFENNSFDVVTCRLGFMFFPDMLLAAKEMFRVLKPGGKICVTVWGTPEKNLWATLVLGIVNKNMDMPKPPAGAPGLYRCAERGLLAGLFHDAGFKRISESDVKGILNAGSIDVYWNFMTDVVAPVVAAMNKADDAIKSKIKNEVYDLFRQKYSDANLAIEGYSLVIYGEK